MQCTSCQGEWTPPPNKSISKCPFCGADILQMLNSQTKELTPETVLRNMMTVYGVEVLQNQQRLSALIGDLFAYDTKIKKLLQLSVREKIPQQMVLLGESDQREIHVQVLQQNLKADAFLHDDAARQIIRYWCEALDWEEPEETFEIAEGVQNIALNKIVRYFGLCNSECKVSKNGSFYVRIIIPAGTEGCEAGGALIASVSGNCWTREKLLAHKCWKVVETELTADYKSPDGKFYPKGHRNIKAIPAILEEV